MKIVNQNLLWQDNSRKSCLKLNLQINYFLIFQLEIIDACVNYIETLQTQLNVVSKDDEDQDLANNNDVIDEDIENEHSNEKSDKL